MKNTLKEEGFVNKAMQLASGAEGRWIANQTLFNGSDNDPVNEVAKAATITSIRIQKETAMKHVDLDPALQMAIDAKTKGDLRAAIQAVDQAA